MNQVDYIGYALDLLDADARHAVDVHLAANPDDVARLDRVRAALAVLQADREDDAPPTDLAARTIARVAAEFPEAETRAEPSSLLRSRSSDQPEARTLGGRFRADIFVAAGIGVIAVGLLLSFVNRAWHASEVAACQNNLRILYLGLSGYADTHEGRYPQVGTETYPTADSFVQALADAGQCPPGFSALCPAATPGAAAPVSYAYPLGHRAPNNVVLGQWRSTDLGAENDLIPIGGDYPVAAAAPGGGPTSGHRYGQNVLFMGGNVRFAAVATVGVNGDDIYRNQLGEVAAGVNRVDTVLGRAGDVP
jgi:hypothetical protein